MHVNRGLLGWGVFFIVAGAVPLAVQSGAIDPAVVRRAWELWPLILIGIGLGLVLQRTRVAIVGGLVVSVTFGLIVGGWFAVGCRRIGGLRRLRDRLRRRRRPVPDPVGSVRREARVAPRT